MLFAISIFWISLPYNNCLAVENTSDNITFYVGGVGYDNYTSIQDAINDAKDGYKIFLYNNIYYENIFITKSLDIIGENKDLTVIKGNMQDNVLNIEADWVNISNFMITNDNVNNISQYYSGINVKNSDHIFVMDINIYDCKISVNIGDSYNITIKNCRISNNFGGLYLYNSSFNNIIGCNISNNTLDSVSFYRSSYNIVSNCNISNTISGSGISLRVSSNNTITKNTFVNNSYGVNIVFTQTDDNITSENNTMYKNNFINNLINAHDGYNNSWNDGSNGNYWYDYNGLDNDNDGIGDTPYILYGNTDIYPLINPVELDFIEPEASYLYLTILSPKNKDIVTGLVEIKGTASSIFEILGIKIKINNGLWQDANGTENWFFVWDTTQSDDDFYTVSALVNSTTGDYSIKTITVQVDNIKNKQQEDGNADNVPGYGLFLLIVAFCFVLIIIKFKK